MEITELVSGQNLAGVHAAAVVMRCGIRAVPSRRKVDTNPPDSGWLF